jgi:transposase InsO family protein
MQDADRLTIEQMSEFLQGSRAIEFSLRERLAVYGFLERVLEHQHYARLPKLQRGIVRAYLIKLTGLSRAQLTRLLGRWLECRQIRPLPAQRPHFVRRYRPADIALLARTDAAHEGLSGPAMCHILQREYQVHHQPEFERLAGLSVSHLYNLRHSQTYRNRRIHIEPTRPTPVSIAERRKPDPQGRPGYLRVDTVHQGQHDGRAGPYHINSVDTVTQWEVLGCCAAISELFLIPVLESMLEQYPFVILGFHADNGSEFINYRVAKLLNKLLVEFTKSRPCRSTDNALVEGKNGAVVRKHMGYGLLGADLAAPIHQFFFQHLNPYLNFHRPCGFATITVNQRGQRRRHYPADGYCTPYEKLVSLPNWKRNLKPGVSAAGLASLAAQNTDTQAALSLQKAKAELIGQANVAPRPASPTRSSPLMVRERGLKRRPLSPNPYPRLKTKRKDTAVSGRSRS